MPKAINKLSYKIVLLLFICNSYYSVNSKAQIDAKADPFSIILNSPKVSAEYIFTENLSIEGLVGFDYGRRYKLDEEQVLGFSIAIEPRLYLRQKKVADRFFLAAYFKYAYLSYKPYENQNLSENFTNSKAVYGFLTGYKWLNDSGFLIEVKIGFGRFLFNEYENSNGNSFTIANNKYDGIANVLIGYRLYKNKNNSKSE